MRRFFNFGMAIVAAFALTAVATAPSHAAPRCHSTVQGNASGLGLFGVGSEKARAAAIRNWQSNVGRQYGWRYARFGQAREVVWDCVQGVILPTLCVVGARPCRY